MAHGKWRGGIRAALAILVVATATRLPAAEDAATRERAQNAMTKGLDWLKTNQKPNGSWSDENYPALTALGLWAATKSGSADMTGACAKAAQFVASYAQPDGGIYKPATGGRGTGGLPTYNTAICVMALHGYDRARYTPLILKARDYLVKGQFAGSSDSAGGFGYGPPSGGPRDRADLSNTGWALMAMRTTQDVEDLRPRTSKRADVDWAAAVTFATALQNEDESDTANHGGFGYERGGERGGTTGATDKLSLRGFGSMTYAGLESMIYAQVDRTDPRVRSAIAWAGRHWSVEENPGMGSKGLFYYYTIMAKALSLAGGETLSDATGKAIAWRQQLVDKLVAVQHPDGSWANTDNTFWENDPALVTAYAVLALEYAAGK